MHILDFDRDREQDETRESENCLYYIALFTRRFELT